MALTAAERQALSKARKTQVIDDLTSTNASLVNKNAELQAEVANLREKLHKAEVAALKLQLKAKVWASPVPP